MDLTLPKSDATMRLHGDKFSASESSVNRRPELPLINGHSQPDAETKRCTSTPIRPGHVDLHSTPEASAILADDSTSEKDCPIEFRLECDSSSSTMEGLPCLDLPIVGYEIMDERAKFTVFKLHVKKSLTENWFVFRRYTDFVWLNEQLKVLFPVFRLSLPPKRWFGDNFDERFLDDRLRGLQAFTNNIMGHREVSISQPVRDFLCWDDPPGPHESLEESRAMCECLEVTMYTLRRHIVEKDTKIRELEDLIEMYKTRVQSLEKSLNVEHTSTPDSPGSYSRTTRDNDQTPASQTIADLGESSRGPTTRHQDNQPVSGEEYRSIEDHENGGRRSTALVSVTRTGSDANDAPVLSPSNDATTAADCHGKNNAAVGGGIAIFVSE